MAGGSVVRERRTQTGGGGREYSSRRKRGGMQGPASVAAHQAGAGGARRRTRGGAATFQGWMKFGPAWIRDQLSLSSPFDERELRACDSMGVGVLSGESSCMTTRDRREGKDATDFVLRPAR